MAAPYHLREIHGRRGALVIVGQSSTRDHRRCGATAARHTRGDLPEPTRQSVVRGPDGRGRYRDAHFEEWNLHVEIDGGHHMDIGSWWADMQRQNSMWTPGVRILRFPAWAIRNEPEKVIEAVRRALIEAGWRPKVH